MISVTIDSPELDLGPHWDDLVRRASSNVFMNPAALRAATSSGFAHINLLLAWEQQAASRRLVGLWALRKRRFAPLLPASSEALPYNYAFLSNPVVDVDHVDAVIPAFLEMLAQSALTPKVLSLPSFDAEDPSHAAVMRWLSLRGISPLTLSQSSRPFVTREFGVKRSGSTRKKLRQDWNRLSSLGAVDVTNVRTSEAAREAFETFLSLEMASWKGQRGTALLSKSRDAAFARQLLRNLADRQDASVALLQVNGEAIAAQVLMYGGRTAYTWKTAYDARFARYSPGHLLVDKVTDLLLASPEISAINSCAAEDSFMAQLWAGRRAMVDMLVDVSPALSLGYRIEASRQLGYRYLRRLRDGLRHRGPTASAAKPAQGAAA